MERACVSDDVDMMCGARTDIEPSRRLSWGEFGKGDWSVERISLAFKRFQTLGRLDCGTGRLNSCECKQTSGWYSEISTTATNFAIECDKSFS